MANIIEKVIEISADVKQASADIKKLFDNMLEQQIASEEEQQKLNDSLDSTATSAKNAEKGVTGIAKGFKGVGLAIKALGIGLVLEAFNVLKDVFSQNQKVADFFSTSLKSLSIVFNDLFSYIEENIGGVVDSFKAIFNDPQEAISKLGDIIEDNLIERFESFLDTIGYLGSALKKLFTGDFEGAFEDAKKAGKESIDVLTGVNDTFDRTVKVVGDVADNVSKYAKEVWSAADAMTALENQVKLAIAQNQGLIEKYDILAEKQRQIRDNESETIADRIKANDELKNVLDEQQKAMLRGADLAIQSAKLNLKLNNSIDNQVALITAQNEKLGILAQIEGFRSEQKVNEISLQKELNTLNQTAIDGNAKRAIASKKFTDSLIKDSLDRLKAERDAIDSEYKLELERLENKKALYKEGTQAFADAQQEILDLKLDTDQKIIENDNATNETQTENHRKRLEAIISDNLINFEDRFSALEEERVILNEAEYASEEDKTKALKENTDARIALSQAEQDAKLASLDAIGNALGTFSQLVGEQTAAGKALAIAQATIDTYTGISGVWGAPNPYPEPYGTAIKVASTAAIAASGFMNVKKILAVKVPGGSGGSAGGGSVAGGGAPPKASFNIVGQSSTNQLAQTIGAQQNQPVEAFVVGSSVSTQQALDRNRIQNSTFLFWITFISMIDFINFI